MTKNSKLRLLVTKKCINDCKLCCNKQFDLDSLPIVDRIDYDEISITGGEPLLFPRKVKDLYESIKIVSDQFLGKTPRIYVYSSIFDYYKMKLIYGDSYFHIDGFTMTPHTVNDVHDLYVLNKNMMINPLGSSMKDASFRLNLFPDMKSELDKYDIDLSMWDIKEIEWLENCPLPKGEDFCRLSKLW